MPSKTPRLRLGKRKILRREGWISAYIQPSGKFWKRKASKKFRKSDNLNDGAEYKKLYGWMEWS